MRSDILPTGFRCGVLNGQIKPGDTVAIVGSGPIGLAALLTTQFFSPAEIIVIDTDDNSLEIYKKFGATKLVNNSDGKAVQKVMALTNNRGVNVAIEAIGMSQPPDICQAIVAVDGHVVVVHGNDDIQSDMNKLSARDFTLRTRFVDTVATPMLLKTVVSGDLQPKQLIRHHFAYANVMKEYGKFCNAMLKSGG